MPEVAKDKRKHYEYFCIGSESCNKQKMIAMLFQDTLRLLGSKEVENHVVTNSRFMVKNEETEKPFSDFLSLMG